MCLTSGHVLTVYTEIAIFDHQHYLTITICCPWMRWSVWICGAKLLGRQLRSWYLCQAIPRFTQGISPSCKQSRTRATQRYILVTMWDSRISCTISSIYKRQYSAQNQIVLLWMYSHCLAPSIHGIGVTAMKLWLQNLWCLIMNKTFYLRLLPLTGVWSSQDTFVNLLSRVIRLLGYFIIFQK